MIRDKADLILRNGRIFTAEESLPWAEAVACSRGRILAVGKNDEVQALAGHQTQVIDVSGRVVLPGLIDTHVHILWYAMRQRQSHVDLDGINDFASVLDRLQKAAAIAGPGQWIHGWGWDETGWDVQPALSLLDKIVPQAPMALRRKDLHTWWVNRTALDLAGITKETPDPPGCRLGRDAAGELTGVLHEWGAIRLVEEHIPGLDEATLQKWLRETVSEAHRLGLTGIHDQRLQNDGLQAIDGFLALHRQGNLDLRVCMHVNDQILPKIDSLKMELGPDDDRLWLGQLKIFADGSMGARTALMLEHYENEPNNCGIAVTGADSFREQAERARRSGLAISVHAIGDRAVRETINLVSAIPTSNSTGGMPLPHRIEHVQVIDPHDIPRLGQHGIIASMQPVHLISDWQTAERVWGERSRYAYAFRSLLNHHTQLAFGSDAPFAPLNPMTGIYAAVTRQDERGEPSTGWYPEERLSVVEAVHAYTMGAAGAAGKQHIQGSIRPGKWAD
ncbi:MAG: amidohydrolase, partial [Chloroflexota bacterium]